jgi:hypothetical protein
MVCKPAYGNENENLLGSSEEGRGGRKKNEAPRETLTITVLGSDALFKSGSPRLNLYIIYGWKAVRDVRTFFPTLDAGPRGSSAVFKGRTMGRFQLAGTFLSGCSDV